MFLGRLGKDFSRKIIVVLFDCPQCEDWSVRTRCRYGENKKKENVKNTFVFDLFFQYTVKLAHLTNVLLRRVYVYNYSRLVVLMQYYNEDM